MNAAGTALAADAGTDWPNMKVPDGKLQGSTALHLIAGQRPRQEPSRWRTWLAELVEKADGEAVIREKSFYGAVAI